MSQYTFYTIVVIRDATLHIPRTVSGWELPVLNEVFGEGNIEIKEEFTREFATPDIEPEKARLERMYGKDETQIPYVEVAYGRGPACMKALAKAIAASEVKDTKVDKKAADKF